MSEASGRPQDANTISQERGRASLCRLLKKTFRVSIIYQSTCAYSVHLLLSTQSELEPLPVPNRSKTCFKMFPHVDRVYCIQTFFKKKTQKLMIPRFWAISVPARNLSS